MNSSSEEALFALALAKPAERRAAFLNVIKLGMDTKLAVTFVAENVAALVATGGEVVSATGDFNAQRAGHAGVAEATAEINC